MGGGWIRTVQFHRDDVSDLGMHPFDLLRAMHDLVAAGGQFVVATHSPLLMAYPGAALDELDDDGIRSVAYDELAPVTLYRTFLDSPERILRALLAD